MYKNRGICENTSTPKRRRLGTGRILRSPRSNVFQKQFNPGKLNNINSSEQSSQRCESPPIPCNQKEYLSDSAINSSCSNSNCIPQSPGLLDSSFEPDDAKTTENSRVESPCHIHIMNTALVQNEIENISDEMFHSKLEIQESFTENHEKDTILTSRCEQNFRRHIDESFEIVNQSICGLESNCLLESKDSFPLDTKEFGDIPQQTNYDNGKTFYGLPLITKSLFKTYRNIEKFYDWQEECLNLDAIKNRQNLIYALPTSGGKTLVAEVLMLNEVLNRKQNALFILPFVAIVQEKIWQLSPFAVQLDFLVEEYAAGKGHIPPKKRRKKKSIYIATIEKGLALVRSLIELDRLSEIGLIVVDELHLIGEAGRGGTLETLLSTVIYANRYIAADSSVHQLFFSLYPSSFVIEIRYQQRMYELSNDLLRRNFGTYLFTLSRQKTEGIQVVGMSATLGNLPELARFLRAAVYERQFRPVELVEYVKLGDSLQRLQWASGGPELTPHRDLHFDYSAEARTLDPDRLGGLVSEVTPAGSCLVFCPTKRNCENVAALLCRMQRREMRVHRSQERGELAGWLRGEGAGADLCRDVTHGVAYHHAGLAADERHALENAFRSGVISVLCCTSTLAAGVNLPARRVIVRAPLVGRDPLSLSAYRQMVGRAGRTGHADHGESIVICSAREWPAFLSTLRGGLAPAVSTLAAGGGGEGGAVGGLVLSAVALRLADTAGTLRDLLDCTLCAVQADRLNVDMGRVCDEAIRSLLQSGAVHVQSGVEHVRSGAMHVQHDAAADCHVYNDTVLAVSKLGSAAIKGCMDVRATRQLADELGAAARGLVLAGSAHLLYLCTPRDAAGIRPDYSHYYTLYCGLNEECRLAAHALGITEHNAIRMVTGKPLTNVPETVLRRFYLALILYDMWNQVDITIVVEKYGVSRGAVQQALQAAAGACASAARVCSQLGEERWPFLALFTEMAPRLQHCAAPELAQLCQLPNVRKSRALQLSRAGYKRIEQVARASVDDLAANIDHLSRSAAAHLVSAARLMLIEKVENLRADAEDVMEELNM